jgi:hypothetical protein
VSVFTASYFWHGLSLLLVIISKAVGEIFVFYINCILWTGFLCLAAWKTGIECVLCCRAGQMAEIRLSPINISRVILEMGEERHAVSDIKRSTQFLI